MTLYQDSRPVITMTDNSVNRKGSRQIATLKYFIFFFLRAFVQENLIVLV
jgi:hypothetical protein